MDEFAPRSASLEEYEELDARSSEKLEYRRGVIVALAAPSGNHERVAINLVMALGPSARARGCDIFASGAKVIAPNGDRLIPDLVITCDERDRRSSDRGGENVVRHPWLVIEIASPSSAADDIGEKLDAYRSIAETTHYLVIDSRRRVMRFYDRDPGEAFVVRGTLEAVELAHLGVVLRLDDVYRDTTVPKIASALLLTASAQE